jgi:hypothetical protein
MRLALQLEGNPTGGVRFLPCPEDVDRGREPLVSGPRTSGMWRRPPNTVCGFTLSAGARRRDPIARNLFIYADLNFRFLGWGPDGRKNISPIVLLCHNTPKFLNYRQILAQAESF